MPLELLGKYGLLIEATNNGFDVIEMVRNSIYDLILMDIQMQSMNGIDATCLIRKITG